MAKHLQKMFQYENVICARNFQYEWDETEQQGLRNSLNLNEKSIWIVNYILGQMERTHLLFMSNKLPIV